MSVDKQAMREDFLLALAGMVMLGIKAIVAAVPVTLLWNWLVPDLFGLKAIEIWQAWGLVVLAGLLFKPWGLHPS